MENRIKPDFNAEKGTQLLQIMKRDDHFASPSIHL